MNIYICIYVRNNKYVKHKCLSWWEVLYFSVYYQRMTPNNSRAMNTEHIWWIPRIRHIIGKDFDVFGHGSESSLVQVLACRLLSAMSLPEPMMT